MWNWKLTNFSPQYFHSRDILHRHHVHGGLELRDDHHDPELSPQDGGHPRDAWLGSESPKFLIDLKYSIKVALVFLQWLPWLLKMARPGEKITRKTIMMAKKMKELDIKETSSKSLLSNVLDMDDDFRRSTLPRISPATPHPSHVTPSQNNQGILRSDKICLCFYQFTVSFFWVNILFSYLSWWT